MNQIMSNIRLIKGDCFREIDKLVADGIKVDAIITDPPYGTTANKWDKKINLQLMFEKFISISNEDSVIAVSCQQPFTTDLINAGRKYFRYDIVWEKTNAQGFLSAKKMPLRAHETIAIFYRKLPKYNPQKTYHDKEIGKVRHAGSNRSTSYGKMHSYTYIDDGWRYPRSVIKISNHNGGGYYAKAKGMKATKHPTQKPLDLMEWIIKTYTDENDIVFDPFMGSGSTGVACKSTNRNFIGIELDDKYFDIAKDRIDNA